MKHSDYNKIQALNINKSKQKGEEALYSHIQLATPNLLMTICII